MLRLNIFDNQVAARFSRHIVSAGTVLADSTLPAATQDLVKIRASQINGCGFCVDMHTKDAGHAGETSTRLSLVAAWQEATVFTEAERAALELAEQGTRIADAAGDRTGRGLGECRQALRRGPLRGPGVRHRLHQRFQPRVRHGSAARRRLSARPVRITRSSWPVPAVPSSTSSSSARPGHC